MASLAQSFSLNCGLKLDKPFIFQAPYALPFEKYIIFHNSSGNDNKNYAYFQEVIDLIIPFLKENDIHIVQLGGQNDPALEYCFPLQGKTSIHQTAYLIKNALLTIGNDSMPVHMAGALEAPVVGLYGPTSSQVHGPYWNDPDKTVLIDSHRNGNAPSFHFNENPKTINFITPEEVLNAITKLVGLKPINLESLHFGSKYGQKVIEVVPNSIVPQGFIPNAPLNIRYDFQPNANVLAAQLQIRKGLIITDVPIDINLLRAFKPNIIGMAYEINEKHDATFIHEVQHLGIPVKLFTKWTNEQLNPIKLDYMEIGIIDPEKTLSKDDLEKKHKINSDTFFKSRKVLLSNGKFYLSKIHYKLDRPMPHLNANESNVIDLPEFYEESDYFYIYNK